MVLKSNIHSTEMGSNLNWHLDKERWGNSKREKRKMHERGRNYITKVK